MIRYIKSIFDKAFYLLPVQKNLIVFESEGDLSDNSFALYEYMNEEGLDATYNFVWLVDDINQKDNPYKAKYVKKSGKCDYIRRKYYLSRCKYYIYDHSNFLKDEKRKKDRVIVNLWHGAGVKASPYADKESNIDFFVTTSEFFRDEHAKIFGVNPNKIITTGYPRTDYFFKNLTENQIREQNLLAKYEKVFLWMPTFRRSTNKELDESYFDSYTGLPVFENEEDLFELDNYLKERNLLCIFKIHHLQASLNAFKRDFSNIIIVNDEAIKRKGLTLYQYIMLSDALITDYSSISTDYLLLNKPIIYAFTIDDFKKYKNSRGFFIENPVEYFAGHHVYSKQEMYDALIDVVKENDIFKSERKRVMKLFNAHIDGNASARILKILGIK